MSLITRIIVLIDKLPIDLRRKLHGIDFIVEDKAFILSREGAYVKAQVLGKNSIIFFEPFIGGDEDLAETLIHELCHHFGMDEQQVRNFMKVEHI